MELTHEFTVPADVATTFATFEQVESMAECFPGAQVASVEGDTFTGSVKIKLGPIALTFNGTGEFEEKELSGGSGRMVLSAKGKDKRGNGTAGVRAVVVLAPSAGDSTATDVEVTTDLQIGGKVASMGRGLVQDVSNKMLGRFTDCLEKKLTRE